jgi:hypothetical protein
MRKFAIASLAIPIAFFLTPASAQEANFTQLGTWECTVTGRPSAFVCPRVSFPTAFATVASVSLTGCSKGGACYGRDNIQYTHITASGFTPVLHMGDTEDWRGVDGTPRTVVGRWIAVGSPSHGG